MSSHLKLDVKMFLDVKMHVLKQSNANKSRLYLSINKKNFQPEGM